LDVQLPDEPVLGIDLGTTFCATAIVNAKGEPVIIPNAEGEPTTPSVIHFHGRDACVVGEDAQRMVVADPANVVRFIKRAMGEPDYVLEFHGRSYTPQELSALLLAKLKRDSEAFLGRSIVDCVITVPAYFNAAQRSATAEAGAIAGFQVLSVINEPTTAAVAYGVTGAARGQRILGFDLGGGTFDVTLMEVPDLADGSDGGSFRTVASDGNAELGGKDWDDRLLDHVAERFVDNFGIDPRDDPQAYQALYESCLDAKLLLSSQLSTTIPINFRGHRLGVDVDRDTFEALTQDLVDQCADTCALVLDKAGHRWEDVDEILLVGGSTRMPMIRRMLRQLSNRPFGAGVHPEECVALGAALAGVLRHRPRHPALREPVPGTLHPDAPRLGDLHIADVTSHPLGMVVLDRQHNERITTIIPEATPIPCEVSRRFAYAYDGMTAVRVEVTEGAGSSRDDVSVIGEVRLQGLPPRPQGTPLEVAFRYTEDSTLEVDVVDLDTGARDRGKIDLVGGMGASAVDAARISLSGTLKA